MESKIPFNNSCYYIIHSCICSNFSSRIPPTTQFENVLAQQNDDGSIDTELGGEPELGRNTEMTESDMGGKDIGMTVSDLENDTDIITNNNQTG